MQNDIAIIFAKNPVDVHKLWSEVVHQEIGYNGPVSYIDNTKDLRAVISEYASLIPILLIIGNYLPYEKGHKTTSVEFLSIQAKEIDKLVVFTLSSTISATDPNTLSFSEFEFEKFYKIYEKILTHNQIHNLISEKNIPAIKEIVRKIIAKMQKKTQTKQTKVKKTG